LVSGIFFFGALFVVIVLRVNYKLILKLTENSLRLGELNTVLENKNKELSHKTEELKKSEEKYIKRSKELDETLENFYTMRIGLQKQIDKDTIAFESTILIPLPEAKDFIIQSEKKENIEHTKTLSQEEYINFYNELANKLNEPLTGRNRKFYLYPLSCRSF